MKNVKLFLVIILALAVGFSSCSKSEEHLGSSESQIVSIKLGGADMKSSRALDDSATKGDKKTTFKSGQLIFVYDAKVTSSFEIIETGTTNLDEWKVLITDLTSTGVSFPNIKAKEVYAVGNCRLDGLHVDAKIADVLENAGSQLAVADLKGGKFQEVPLFGSAAVISVGPATDRKAEANVQVRPVISRIEIAKVSDINSYKFDLVGIWINNYYKSLTLKSNFGEEKGTGDDFYGNQASAKETWLNNNELVEKYSGDHSTFHSKVGSTGLNSHVAPDGKVWAFNIFPNSLVEGTDDDTVPHIILHLKNVTDAAGDPIGRDENIYITIGKYYSDKAHTKESMDFKAGHVYTISNLEWDASKGGSSDIEEELVDCNVTVEVLEWIEKDLYPDVH